MNEKQNCKIIQDLLPNYIEKLTNEQTNKFIEGHLNECKECKKVYEKMEENISDEKSKERQKKAVKYFKKYKNKLKFFKFLILAIFIYVFINIGIKIAVISNMQNKIKEYEKVDNYYLQRNSIGDDYMEQIEYFHKGEKFKINANSYNKGGNIERIVYRNSNSNNEYITRYIKGDGEYKYAILNEQDNIRPKLEDILETWKFKTNNILELIYMGITSNISSEICNGKECYKIEKLIILGNSSIPELFFTDKYRAIYYIEKETGLIIRSIDRQDVEVNKGKKDIIIDYEYKFDNILEQEFQEPNINEYKIQANYETNEYGGRNYSINLQ